MKIRKRRRVKTVKYQEFNPEFWSITSFVSRDAGTVWLYVAKRHWSIAGIGSSLRARETLDGMRDKLDYWARDNNRFEWQERGKSYDGITFVVYDREYSETHPDKYHYNIDMTEEVFAVLRGKQKEIKKPEVWSSGSEPSGDVWSV